MIIYLYPCWSYSDKFRLLGFMVAYKIDTLSSIRAIKARYLSTARTLTIVNHCSSLKEIVKLGVTNTQLSLLILYKLG